MLMLYILVGTLVAGIGSVLLAALFSPRASSQYAPDMLSFAAGALLSTACVHLIPEAFEGGVAAKPLSMLFLGGLVLFFVLDKAELWHHGHEHHAPQDGRADAHTHRHPQGHAHAHPHTAHDNHAPHAHSHAHAHATVPRLQRPTGSWAVLLGDSVHCFGDGLLIAAAFIADPGVGALASLAVLVHEVPHHLGDLAVLRQGVDGRRRAVVKVALAGSVTALGGLIGMVLIEQLEPRLPYFLMAAASSFIYVALADLIPQLQKHVGPRQAARHVIWLLVGIGIVTLVGLFDVH